MYVYIFLFSCFLRGFFSCGSIKYEQFSNKSIWSIDGTLTGTTSLGQNKPGSNSNEEISSHFPDLQTGFLTIRYSLMSYPGHPPFFLGILFLCRRYSQHSLSSTNRLIRLLWDCGYFMWYNGYWARLTDHCLRVRFSLGASYFLSGTKLS